jgi:ligand-binding sensor domain-containing protein
LTAPARTVPFENPPPSNVIRKLLFDHEHTLWMAQQAQGVSKLTNQYLVEFPISNVPTAFGHRVVSSDRNNHVWAVGNDSLREFWRDRSMRWHSYTHSFGGRDSIISLVIDSGGKLWTEIVRNPA